MWLILLAVMVVGFVGFYLCFYPRKLAWKAIMSQDDVAIYVRSDIADPGYRVEEHEVIASVRDMATEVLESHGIKPYQIYDAVDLAELQFVGAGEVYLFELIVFLENRTDGQLEVVLSGCLRQWPSGVELVSSRDEYFREHGSKIYVAVGNLLNQLVKEFDAVQRIASDKTSNMSVPIGT